MSQQPYAVHRISAHKLTDIVHRTRESESNIAIQLSPQALANKEFRSSINKPQKDVAYEAQNKISHNDALPRSAPLRLNKLSSKDECKELKTNGKVSQGGSTRTKFPEIQTPDRFKSSNPLKMPRISIEDSKKGTSSGRKLKETPGKMVRTQDDEKTPEMMYGFETDRANAKNEIETDREAYIPSMQGDVTPRRFENSTYIVSSRNSPIVESIEDDGESAYNGDKGKDTDEIRESGEELNDEQNSRSKLTQCSRGILRRENIPVSELQKQTDQKKKMKEYLDFQLNEKKRQKEEEKQKQLEFERREEERIKNEINVLERRHERELTHDAKKSSKSDRTDVRQTASSTLREIPTVEPEHAVVKEEKVKSRESAEGVKNVEDSQKNIKETGEVDVLVEENKHLRDENTKKKEIIDILINALRQQNDQARVPLYQNQSVRKNSSSSRLVTPNSNLVNIKNIDATYNQFSHQNDGLYEDKYFVPPQNNQQYFEPNKYFSNPRSEMTGNIDMSSDLSHKPYLMNAPTPAKNNNPYRIFVPSRQELESGHNYFTEAASPKIIRSENTIFSPKATNFKGETNKQSLQSKAGFLPILTEPSSVKSYQKSNLISNLDMGTNSSRNFDNPRFHSPIKKENLGHKEKEAPSMKYSFSDVNLYKSGNPVKPIKDQTNVHKNLLDLLNPISISKINVPKTVTNSPDLRYPGNLMKVQQSITVVDDGGSQTESQLKPYPLPLHLRSNGNAKGFSGISIIDMAVQGNNSNRTTAPDSQIEEIKPYGMMRLSQRIVSDQTGNVSRTKFPIEVFNINMKRNLKEKVQL